MDNQDRNNLFSDLVARHQSELYGYIFAVVRNWQDADDLFQSVCLVLWRKFESFRVGSSFFAWARQTARIEVSRFLRQRQSLTPVRERLLDDIVERAVAVESSEADTYSTALRRCTSKLPAADEQLLDLHYAEDLGSRQIADRLQRPQSSVCHSLNRIRRWLLECIQKELARQEHLPRKHAHE
jgi:RNA polymerase sigma-70 factor, ECF subfamily